MGSVLVQRRFLRPASRLPVLLAVGVLASSAWAFPGDVPGEAGADASVPRPEPPAGADGVPQAVSTAVLLRAPGSVPPVLATELPAGAILVAIPYFDPHSGTEGLLLLHPGPSDSRALGSAVPPVPPRSSSTCGACADVHGAARLCERREQGGQEETFRLRF